MGNIRLLSYDLLFLVDNDGYVTCCSLYLVLYSCIWLPYLAGA